MMKEVTSKSTIALLSMVFLLLIVCCDDNTPEGGDIESVEIPSSDASSPIISGQMIVVRGIGFNENSKIWLQGSIATKTSGVQADIISYSNESISFIAPKISGNCNVVLEQNGKTQELGQVYLEERNIENLPEYVYAIGYAKNPDSVDELPSEGNSSYTTKSDNINLPILYLYDSQNGVFENKNELPHGEIIKFALPENDGNGNTYYFKYLPETKQVGLYGYNIKEQIENMVCMDWLNKFTNTAPGMAIGIIENTLCGVEASINKGFEIVSFGKGGKTTLLKKAFPYDKIDGKYVTQFYCEDDNLIFTYDKESRCVLLPGNIGFKDDDESYSCVLSLNMRTGDVKVLRDEQDAYFYEVLATKQGIILVMADKSNEKTILKLINPETLETISVLDEVNEYIVFSIYNEKNNSIYWPSSNGMSEDYVFGYNFDSKQINVSSNSLPYIETLFSIKY